MTKRSALAAILRHEDLNFLVTNRIPRRLATRFMGWFSRIEQPAVRKLSIAVWQRFAELNLHEAEKQQFDSLRDCFTRALKPGARPIDPDPAVLTSPCDAIVGASGTVRGDVVLQAKGFPYTLADLFGRPTVAELYRDGTPKLTDKGTPWKAAYHLPRALMHIMQLFDGVNKSPLLTQP